MWEKGNLNAKMWVEARESANQSRDLIKEKLGDFPHYMDLLEKVTGVNREWDVNEALKREIDVIKSRRFPTCHNLGSGNITQKEIERLKKVFGVEKIINIDLIDHKVTDLAADITDLPFAEASLDLTYNSSVLEHLPNPFLALRENYRILKTGGYAYFWVPFLWRDHGGDLWRFTRGGLQLLLCKAGFQNISLFSTQVGVGNCLAATSVQSLIPDYNKDLNNPEASYRKLLFLLIHEYASRAEPRAVDEFYCGICAICRK